MIASSVEISTTLDRPAKTWDFVVLLDREVIVFEKVSLVQEPEANIIPYVISSPSSISCFA